MNKSDDPRIMLEVIAAILALIGLGLMIWQQATTVEELQIARSHRDATLLNLAAEQLRSERETVQTGPLRHRPVSAAKYTLEHAATNEVPLTGLDASGANLSGANLNGADLRGSLLRETSLAHANLEHADLGVYTAWPEDKGAATDMSGADLTSAQLVSATLTGSDLSNAILNNADLTGASMRDAIFRGADISGADFRDTNLDAAQLEQACGTNVTLPARLENETLKACPTPGAEVTPDDVTRSRSQFDAGERYTAYDGNVRAEEGPTYEGQGVILGQTTDGDFASFHLSLEKDVGYAFIGICDIDCEDLDLALYDPAERGVASDFLLDDMPVIEYTPDVSGMFTVEAIMATCGAEEGCEWAVQIMRTSTDSIEPDESDLDR